MEKQNKLALEKVTFIGDFDKNFWFRKKKNLEYPQIIYGFGYR